MAKPGGENDVDVWRRLCVSDLTTEEHERLARSLWQTQTTIEGQKPRDANGKRARTMAIRFLVQMRRELREQYGAVYADPVMDWEIVPDPDVWGECIEGLDMFGVEVD